MGSKSSGKCSALKGLLAGYLETIACPEAKKRYQAKLAHISGQDPYEIPRKQWFDDLEKWPSISYIHVGMYLLFSESPYTKDQLMNYKSLDCYEKFANGWVREVLVKEFSKKRLMIAKVNHSQRLSEKPLTPWVICEDSGRVIAAHCDCMAGLGESCSHVASLLWALEAGAKQRDSLTVTDKKAYWVLPSSVKTVPYARIKDINFHQHPKPASCPATASKFKCTPAPSSIEMTAFYGSLARCKSKPVILSLIEDLSLPYVPKSLSDDLPLVLSDLFNKELLSARYPEILRSASEIADSIVVTADHQKAVEERTRQQSGSRVWMRMRTGRITASRFKSACHTDPASPSQSLIMATCYPELAKFSTVQTAWGCDHEKTARKVYQSIAQEKHEEFEVKDCGLFLSTMNGFIGASPDGLVTCSCCDKGVCEIKVSGWAYYIRMG